MTRPTAELAEARDYLSRAFELLDRSTGRLPALEAGAVVQLRVEVGATIKRLSNVIVFGDATTV